MDQQHCFRLSKHFENEGTLRFVQCVQLYSLKLIGNKGTNSIVSDLVNILKMIGLESYTKQRLLEIHFYPPRMIFHFIICEMVNLPIIINSIKTMIMFHFLNKTCKLAKCLEFVIHIISYWAKIVKIVN